VHSLILMHIKCLSTVSRRISMQHKHWLKLPSHHTPGNPHAFIKTFMFGSVRIQVKTGSLLIHLSSTTLLYWDMNKERIDTPGLSTLSFLVVALSTGTYVSPETPLADVDHSCFSQIIGPGFDTNSSTRGSMASSQATVHGFWWPTQRFT